MRKGLLALLPLVLVLAACRTGVTMWDACSVPPGGDSTGTDGTYVLVCKDGRWEPIMTNDEYIAIAQERPVTIAPLPTPPVETPTSTTTIPPTTTTTTPPPPDNVVSAGDRFSCAVVDGAAKCWGSNSSGQLGDSSVGYSTDVPTQVQGLTSGVTTVSAGTDHACAIVDGAAKCWGANGYGQLGDSSVGYSTDVPTQVQGLTSGVTAIDAGTDYSCAVVDNTATCWGKNDYGQLGDSSAGYSTDVPTQVQGLTSGVTAVSAGNSVSCAVVGAAAKCWGKNDYGQLGDSTAGYSTDVPTQVQGLTSGVTAVSTAIGRGGSSGGSVGSQACAVVDRTVWCWGANSNGQLGSPSSTYYSSDIPLQVPLV